MTRAQSFGLRWREAGGGRYRAFLPIFALIEPVSVSSSGPQLEFAAHRRGIGEFIVICDTFGASRAGTFHELQRCLPPQIQELNR